MNKRAIELSVNMFVMITLAIVIFSFGIKFAKDVFSTSSQLAETSFKDADRAIQDLACASAERVCLPASTKTVDGSKPAFFGVVVENVLQQERVFVVDIDPVNATQELKTLPTDTEPREESIKPKEKHKFGIAVANEGAQKNTYTFKATVKYKKDDGTLETYSTAPLLFYVNVP